MAKVISIFLGLRKNPTDRIFLEHSLKMPKWQKLFRFFWDLEKIQLIEFFWNIAWKCLNGKSYFLKWQKLFRLNQILELASASSAAPPQRLAVSNSKKKQIHSQLGQPVPASVVPLKSKHSLKMLKWQKLFRFFWDLEKIRLIEFFWNIAWKCLNGKSYFDFFGT